MQKQYDICLTGDCPEGMASIRKIGLTPDEKRAIFHSIINLSTIRESLPEGERKEQSAR